MDHTRFRDYSDSDSDDSVSNPSMDDGQPSFTGESHSLYNWPVPARSGQAASGEHFECARDLTGIQLIYGMDVDNWGNLCDDSFVDYAFSVWEDFESPVASSFGNEFVDLDNNVDNNVTDQSCQTLSIPLHMNWVTGSFVSRMIFARLQVMFVRIMTVLYNPWAWQDTNLDHEAYKLLVIMDHRDHLQVGCLPTCTDYTDHFACPCGCGSVGLQSML